MNKNAILALSIMAAGLCAAGETTSYGVTADWDSVSSANYEDGTSDLSSTNGWTRSGRGVSTVSDRVIVVDACRSDKGLEFTPKAPTSVAGFETVYVRLTNVASGETEELATAPQAALRVADGRWQGWCGGTGAGWREMTNVTPGAQECVVRFEFDNRSSEKLVRYAVKQGASDFIVLKCGDVEWFANGKSASCVNGVAFTGQAALTDIKLTQSGNVTADDEFQQRMSDQGVTEATLNDTAANGNANWENIVLGLDGKDPASKPVVLPKQTGDPAYVTLALSGVAVNTGSGAAVKYTVVSSDEAGGAGTESIAYNYDKDATVALPGSGVKYYRMKVMTTPMQ